MSRRHPDDRQLRLVHLQPRPVPGRARRRGRRASATTRSRVDEVAALAPDGDRRSRPGRARRTRRAISVPRRSERFAGAIPILGVCLGHQAIGAAFGGEIVRAERIMHGKTSPIRHDGRGAVRRPPEPVRGHPLPLARDRPATSAARVPRGDRLDGRRRDHGRAPPRAVRRGRAVPSRVDPDPRGQAAARRTSSRSGAGGRARVTIRDAIAPPRRRARPRRGRDARRSSTTILAGTADAGADRRVPRSRCA